MCEKCDKLDQKIAGVRQIVVGASDKTDLEAADTLIERWQIEKLALHPERGE